MCVACRVPCTVAGRKRAGSAPGLKAFQPIRDMILAKRVRAGQGVELVQHDLNAVVRLHIRDQRLQLLLRELVNARIHLVSQV